jgi:hypothetical protein
MTRAEVRALGRDDDPATGQPVLDQLPRCCGGRRVVVVVELHLLPSRSVDSMSRSLNGAT